MLERPGWNEAAERVVRGLEGAAAKTIPCDLKRPMDRALVKTSGFAEAIVDHME